MGHGNHWEAIEPDLDRCLAEIIPWTLTEGKLLGEPIRCDIYDDERGMRPAMMAALAAPVQYLALVATNPSARRGALFSAYPFLVEGIRNRLVVEDIHPWDNQAEGTLSASTPEGACIGFFDPLFYRNRGLYEVGASYDFSVAGLAYRLGKPKQDFIEITEGPLLELERQRQEESPDADVGEVESVRVYLTGALILTPCSDAEDEFGFRVPVEAVERFGIGDRTFYRLTATLIRTDDGAVSAYLYVSQAALEDGYVPQCGDDVEGRLWLQGYPVTEREQG